jgi:hypothetical protein
MFTELFCPTSPYPTSYHRPSHPTSITATHPTSNTAYANPTTHT